MTDSEQEAEGNQDELLDCSECGGRCKDQETRIQIYTDRCLREVIWEKVSIQTVDSGPSITFCETCAAKIETLKLPISEIAGTLMTKAEYLADREEVEEIIKNDPQFSRDEDSETRKATQKPEPAKPEPDPFCKKCGRPWELDETMIDVFVQRSILLANVPGMRVIDAVDDKHLGPFCEECAAHLETLDIPLTQIVKGFKSREEYYKSPDRITISSS